MPRKKKIRTEEEEAAYQTERRERRAQQQRDRRTREGELARQARLEDNRLKQRDRRAREGELARQSRLEEDRLQQRDRRTREGELARLVRLEENRLRRAKQRQNETEQERAIRRENDRLRHAYQRRKESQTNVTEHLEYQRIYQAYRRQNESENHCFSKKGHESPDLKQEELMLEDYEDSEVSMECQTTDEFQLRNADEVSNVPPSTTEIKHEIQDSPFETIYCEVNPLEIKQEVEDVCDVFGSPNEISSSSTSTQSTIISESSSEQYTSKIIIDNQQSSCAKLVENLSNTMGKKRKAEDFQHCKICLNVYFTSHFDLLEHCYRKHSDIYKCHPVSASRASQSAISVGSDPPDKPPSSGNITDQDTSNGVFFSLEKIAHKKRKTAKAKILELIEFMAGETVDPSSVKFSV